MLLAFSDPDLGKKWEAVRSNVRGLVFFGTLHTTASADLLFPSLLSRRSEHPGMFRWDDHVGGFYGDATQSDVAATLLIALNEEFRLFMRAHREVAILSFYDAHPVKFPWKTTPTLTKKAIELGVPGEESYMLNTDFLNLVRHDSPTSSSYVRLLEKLKTMVQGVRHEWNASHGLGNGSGLPIRPSETSGAMHDSESGARRR
jgi:hypothetical protein